MTHRNVVIFVLVSLGFASLPIVAMADWERDMIGPRFYPVCADEVEGSFELLVDFTDDYDTANYMFTYLRIKGSISYLDVAGRITYSAAFPISQEQWGTFNNVESTFQPWQEYCVENHIDSVLLDLFGGPPYDPDVGLYEEQCAQAPGDGEEEP